MGVTDDNLEGVCFKDLGLWKRYPVERSKSKGRYLLAGVVQWIEHQPANQKVAGLIFRFLVRAHAWLAGQVLIWEHARGNK